MSTEELQLYTAIFIKAVLLIGIPYTIYVVGVIYKSIESITEEAKE